MFEHLEKKDTKVYTTIPSDSENEEEDQKKSIALTTNLDGSTKITIDTVVVDVESSSESEGQKLIPSLK